MNCIGPSQGKLTPNILADAQTTLCVVGYDTAARLLKSPDFDHWSPPKNHRAGPPSGFVQTSGRWFDLWHASQKSAYRREMLAQISSQALLDLHPHIQVICAEQLERCACKSAFDLMADYSVPVTLAISARLFGLTGEENREFCTLLSNSKVNLISLLMPSPEGMTTDQRAFIQLLAQTLSDKDQEPRRDFLSPLLASLGRGHVQEQDLLAFACLLLFASSQNMANFLGLASIALLTHEPARCEVEDRGLSSEIINELLRYDSPVQEIPLFARTHKEVCGHALHPGQLVRVMIGQAHRDDRLFESPAALDFSRRLYPALSFGLGSMTCVGKRLAEMIAQEALGQVLSFFPRMRLAEQTLAYHQTPPVLRAPKAVWVHPSS